MAGENCHLVPFSQSKLGVKNVPVYDTKFMLVMYFSIFIKVEWHCSCKNTYFERSVACASFIPSISTHTLVMQETTWCWCFQWNNWWVHFGRIPQLTGSLNLRDPSTCDLAGSHSRDPYPIRAALRLTTRWEIRPKRSFRIFQGVLSKLRCSELLLFLPSKTNVASNHRCLKQAFSYLHVHW